MRIRKERRHHLMLTAIVRFSLRYRGVVLALALALLGYGIYSLTQANFSVFPEFAPPFVTVQTEAPGLSPEQVELLVTQRIENAVNGVTGIQSLRSSSIQGLSVITIVFRSDSEVYRDRQLVAERRASANHDASDIHHRRSYRPGAHFGPAVADDSAHDG